MVFKKAMTKLDKSVKKLPLRALEIDQKHKANENAVYHKSHRTTVRTMGVWDFLARGCPTPIAVRLPC